MSQDTPLTLLRALSQGHSGYARWMDEASMHGEDACLAQAMLSLAHGYSPL